MTEYRLNIRESHLGNVKTPNMILNRLRRVGGELRTVVKGAVYFWSVPGEHEELCEELNGYRGISIVRLQGAFLVDRK